MPENQQNNLFCPIFQFSILNFQFSPPFVPCLGIPYPPFLAASSPFRPPASVPTACPVQALSPRPLSVCVAIQSRQIFIHSHCSV